MKKEDKENRRLRNGGFSLVELLVVLAVMAVLATAGISGIGMLTGFRMNDCVKKLDSGLLETRIDTVCRGSGGLTVYCENDGSYYMQKAGEEKERIADDAVTISYVCDDGVEYPLSAGASITFTYEQGSGKTRPLQEKPTQPETERYCESLIVRMGERHEARIRFITETGRHYVE